MIIEILRATMYIVIILCGIAMLSLFIEANWWLIGLWFENRKRKDNEK